MTRLRTGDGLDLAQLKERFGYDLLNAHRAYLDRLHAMEKIEYRKHVMVLTNQGKLLADKISADLFVSAE